MRNYFLISIAAVLVWLPGPARAGVDYSGEWSYQALNAGDTRFQVRHQDETITFYRVLHPEYEGKTYRLEHIYRGTLGGQAIAGKLFVREEGMAEFEFLRPFRGTIESDDRMQMDELPLRRERAPVPEAPAAPARYTQVIIQRPPAAADNPPVAEPPDSPAAVVPEALPKSQAAAAPTVIPQLIPAGRAESLIERRAGELLAQGDAAYEAGQLLGAERAYTEALRLDPGRVELLYKLGLVHGTLGNRAVRDARRSEASAHLSAAVGYWERAARLDPYNWGARENIRRAETKLARLRTE